MTPRIAGGVEVTDGVDVCLDVAGQVAVRDLLMIIVKHGFDMFASDFFNDFKCLAALGQIISRMIDFFLEGLDDQGDVVAVAGTAH